MINSVNTVILSGCLGGDPEYFQTKRGRPMVRFTVDVNESFRSQDNDVERTYHVPVAYFGILPDDMMQRLRIGAHVIVQGRVATSDYTTKSGFKRTSVNINANTVDIVAENQNSPGYPMPSYSVPQQSYPQQQSPVPQQMQQQPPVPQQTQQQDGFVVNNEQFASHDMQF